MLDTLISAQREGKIEDDGIREEVDTFVFEVIITHIIGKIFIFYL